MSFVRSSKPIRGLPAVFLAAGVLSSSIVFILSGCQHAPSPEVLATVNGKEILAAELDRIYKQSLDPAAPAPSKEEAAMHRLQLLHGLIEDEILQQRAGKLNILYLRPLDLSVDETVREIIDAVKSTGAKRLVIDSLAGFEMALAPGFRTDFRESLYRMIGALTRIGVTILTTVEVEESFTELLYSTYSISFLSDDIIRLRYVEIDGELRKMLVVVKMRGGDHSKELREYDITATGIVVGERLKGYRGLLTGIPGPFNS